MHLRARRAGGGVALALTATLAFAGGAHAAAEDGRIAFEASDYPAQSIWTIAKDGSDARLVAGNLARDPSFSRSGRRLVFVRHFNVLEARADGSQAHRLTASDVEDNFSPTYSPRGDLIAYIRGMEGGEDAGYGRLYVVRPDGTEKRRLTADRASNGIPRISPNGKQVILPSDESPGSYEYDLHSIDTDDGDRRRLTNPRHASDFSVRFSPDGRRVLFVRAKVGDDGNEVARDLYLMDRDGSHVRRLTTSPDEYESDPSFSPDGRRILFETEPEDAPFYDAGDIVSMKTDGSDRRRLARSPDGEFDPHYSPSGDLVVYARWHGEQADLHVVRADGTRRRRLTATAGVSEYPSAWLPAGATTAK